VFIYYIIYIERVKVRERERESGIVKESGKDENREKGNCRTFGIYFSSSYENWQS
jgi:hypothetical protein